jgi:hypothetical protein
VTTYIGTSPPKHKQEESSQQSVNHAVTPTLITIPSSSIDTFTQLIGTKLQPQWAHRQTLVVENGSALALQDGEWHIRVGDVKVPSSPGQGAAALRGMLVELSYNVESQEDQKDGAVSDDDQTMIRGFLTSMTEATGLSMDSIRAMFRPTSHTVENDSQGGSASDFRLATLYMDMLRGSKG